MEQVLAEEGVRLDGVYFCPHKPEDGCLCRKPEVGLIEKASQELGFDAQRSIVIGDKGSDVEMGRRVRAKTLLVRTGHGAQAAAENSPAPDYIVDHLCAAVETIRQLKQGTLWQRSEVRGD